MHLYLAIFLWTRTVGPAPPPTTQSQEQDATRAKLRIHQRLVNATLKFTFSAIQFKKLSTLKEMLEQTRPLITANSSSSSSTVGFSLLHTAASFGRVEKLQYLLEKWASPHLHTPEGVQHKLLLSAHLFLRSLDRNFFSC
jgi:hypothetical protein